MVDSTIGHALRQVLLQIKASNSWRAPFLRFDTPSAFEETIKIVAENIKKHSESYHKELNKIIKHPARAHVAFQLSHNDSPVSGGNIWDSNLNPMELTKAWKEADPVMIADAEADKLLREIEEKERVNEVLQLMRDAPQTPCK